MKYEGIEGLSENQILELYDEVLETNNMLSVTKANWICYFKCLCTDGSRPYAYGYDDYNKTGWADAGWWPCNSADTNYHISGGCPTAYWESNRHHIEYCRRA